MAIKVEQYRPYVKNTLRGFVDLKLTTTGLTIKECTFHEKDGHNWIGYPARPYETDDGKKWSPVIEFDKESHRKFQDAAVLAINEHLDR